MSRDFLADRIPEKAGREQLSEAVTRQLAEWIENRAVLPGERLPSENELIERFGVARPTVREALSKLRVLGIVEVYQGKGAFVAALPLELLLSRVRRITGGGVLLESVWEVRELLELQVVALAAERCDMGDIAALEASLNPTLEGNWSLENGQFHRLLARATHNPVLEDIMGELMEQVSRALEQAHHSRPKRRDVARFEHRDILEAVRAGNAAGAVAAMREHLLEGRRILGLLEEEA